MFAKRKTRKSSPDPEDRYDNDSAMDVAAPSTPQSRRRIKPSRDIGGMNVPSVPSMSSAARRAASLPVYTAPGTSTCNSFLLGGQYYPGKGKKPKHYQRRTLWYRIFCSSSWRKVLTTVVVSYILLWHVLVPGLHIVLDYGKMLAGGGQLRGSNNGIDAVISDLSLPPIEQQREAADTLKRMKDEINKKGESSRLKLLEKMVPDWYHRNDNAAATNSNNGGGEKVRIKDESPPIVDGGSNDPPEVVNDDEEEHAQSRHQVDPKRREKPSQRTAEEVATPDNMGRHREDPQREKERATEKQKEEQKKGLRGAKTKEDTGNKGETVTMVTDEAEKMKNPEHIKGGGVVAEEKTKGAEEDAPKSMIHAEIHPTETAKEKPQVVADEKSQNEVPASTKEDGSVTEAIRTLHTMDNAPNDSNCPSEVTSINTTLLIQCSLDRMWILEETCRRWVDPIVAVVYLTSKDDSIVKEWKTKCPQMTVVPYVADKEKKEWHYPINHLRNVGLDMVQTSHVIVVDVDFVPSQGLDQTIRSALEERQQQRNVANSTTGLEERDAIVVPAFERIDDCSQNGVDCSQFVKGSSSYLPKSKDELQSCIVANNCTVFQAKNNREGHYSTRSEKWLKGDAYEDAEITLSDGRKSKVLKRVRCFDSLRYEPYVVIRWCPSSAASSTSTEKAKPVAPYYDERFYGYGKNKIQMISHLRMMGYQFSVLPEGFIVHNPHTESKAKKVWNDVQDYKLHETMDALYPQFLQELLAKYRTITDPRIVVAQCERAKKKRL